MNSKEKAIQYQSAYLADYAFERIMVHYRRQFLLERLQKHRPAVVLEIGCGAELLYSEWLELGGKPERWVIVEPSPRFAELAGASGLPGLHVISNYLECATDEVNEKLQTSPDLIICSSLLHEVPSAADLLQAIAKIMGKRSLLHVNVPNSESFHRQLAKEAGLIANTKAMSDRNVNLSQNRIYDMSALKSDLAAADFEIVEDGGYFIKPFTHEQMKKVIPIVGENLLDGLYLMGKKYPDLASEIFVEAHRRESD